MFNKKATIPVLMMFVVLITSVTILITLSIFYFNSVDLQTDTSKLNIQIAQDKILNANCFSNQIGTIEENKFTQTNLKQCFSNIDKIIYFKLKLLNLPGEKEYQNILYYNIDSEGFSQKASLCMLENSKTNLKCFSLRPEVIFITNEGKQERRFLEMSFIAYP